MSKIGSMTGMASLLVALGGWGGCNESAPDSDSKQQAMQEVLLKEGVAQTGMPAIRNFRERKLLKELYELRDQADLVTFTYLFAQHDGRLVFLCDSIGYGIPAATQYTSPQKLAEGWRNSGYALAAVAQADPNGLFSPASAEGTWVMCKDPSGTDVRPVYIEERIVVSPFRMTDDPDRKAERQQQSK